MNALNVRLGRGNMRMGGFNGFLKKVVMTTLCYWVSWQAFSVNPQRKTYLAELVSRQGKEAVVPGDRDHDHADRLKGTQFRTTREQSARYLVGSFLYDMVVLMLVCLLGIIGGIYMMTLGIVGVIFGLLLVAGSAYAFGSLFMIALVIWYLDSKL